MANNQDKGGNQGNTNTGAGNNTAGAGQQAGQGSGGGSQTGQKPGDKMNSEGDRASDTGSKGGSPEHRGTDKQNVTDKDRMGGQQSQTDKPQWDKDR